MSDVSFDIGIHARALNERAKSYAIGEIQKIRKKLRGFARRSGSDLFSGQTTHAHWAFHHGGRSELQFNIGVEAGPDGDEIRHGVAFSFELSQSLPNINILVPKARLFSEYLQLYPEKYADMRMWHWDKKIRSSHYPPGPIMPELVRPGPFVFLGNLQKLDGLDYDIILRDFDRLLALYLYEESGGREDTDIKVAGAGFSFKPGCTVKASTTTATYAERQLNINLRHTLLQAALTSRLIEAHGMENVSDEQPSGLGTKIDAVLRKGANEYWYYEIKTAFSARSCIREALGQILEYSYWPGSQEAKRLIICGEKPLDEDGAAYLGLLTKRFSLPISYEQIVLES